MSRDGDDKDDQLELSCSNQNDNKREENDSSDSSNEPLARRMATTKTRAGKPIAELKPFNATVNFGAFQKVSR